jgi:pyruvate/2-oxoglutarate dehydrogenase complex dihydrolipoamide acyltransferase (E2) component
LEVSTDKVDTEIPAPCAGVIRELLVEENSTVAIGDPLAVIEPADGTPAETPQTPEASPVEPAPPPPPVADAQAAPPADVDATHGDKAGADDAVSSFIRPAGVIRARSTTLRSKPSSPPSPPTRPCRRILHPHGHHRSHGGLNTTPTPRTPPTPPDTSRRGHFIAAHPHRRCRHRAHPERRSTG